VEEHVDNGSDDGDDEVIIKYTEIVDKRSLFLLVFLNALFLLQLVWTVLVLMLL